MGEGVAGAQGVTRRSAPRRTGGRASSCTTVRRTPTATSTSATRSTRSSRTSSSRASSWPASTRPTCPGWDCHGMPIEVQIEKTHGKHLSTAETQRLARAYATEQIASRRKDFKRLGVLGDWDHPYTTMAFKNEADEIRTLGKILEKGYLYRGLKPVNWCFDCQSALAEAEVEYEDRVDIAIDVGFPLDARRSEQAREGVRAGAAAGRTGVRGDLDDDAVDDSRQPGAERASGLHLCAGRDGARAICCSRRTWSTRASSAISLTADVVATAKGARTRAHQVPPSVLRPRVAGLSRRIRDAGAGHRHRPLRRPPTASTISSRAAATA